MSYFSQIVLNQIGLVLGFVGSILLSFSNKVGVVTKDGRVRFEGLDDMDSVDKNLGIVERSHWRNRVFTPVGWVMIVLSFFIQLVATLIPSSQ